ncbi:hypothetical protein PVAR5_8240 [Paecilomyces variotii No. 5]|uniref:Major facilitator superfamily (MFS) profile domain-containing protein n=1 Tax=Byssochlamys spectabilis (strain No. 5 / NBRC 109023) TaxID=1356009 RepID=V5I5R0_BYSSN|nr:hypothetical protein PVAR5_8240 [Paecilomyces variotii No. 5]
MSDLSSDVRKDQFDTTSHLEDVSTYETETPADAPINWPAWKRNAQILMVAFHSMDTVFMAAGIIPGYEAMAEAYKVTVPEASYLTSAQILVLGIAPFFWIPITARFGRYHIFMFSVLASMVLNIGGAYCKSFGAQMATRVLVAWFIAPPIGIGSGVVAELCYPEERGQKIGWWTLMTVLGIPGGAFINGFVVQHLGFEWIFFLFAIINAAQFVAYVLLGDETLYVKDSPRRTGLARFIPHRMDHQPIKVGDFFKPLSLGKFPRVLIPAIAHAVSFAYANIAVIIETPLTFGEKFHFNAQQVGYQFAAVIVGSLIGEQVSGPMSDWFLKTRRERTGHSIPADRLWLSYIGFGTVIAGLLTWGFQLEKATTWNITPCVGMAIDSFGNQILTTTLISFAVDSHREYSASVGVFINLFRQVFGFLGPFYFPDMFAALGLGGAAGLMCGLIVVASLAPTVIIQVIDSRRKH